MGLVGVSPENAQPLLSKNGGLSRTQNALFVLAHAGVGESCPLSVRLQLARYGWFLANWAPRGNAAGYTVAVRRGSRIYVL